MMNIKTYLLFLLLPIFSGCTSISQIRTDYSVCVFNEATGSGCGSSALEEHSASDYSYSLGFVELDDQGCLWDRDQLNVLKKYSAEISADKSPVLFLVFVHGWKNNTEPDNSNLLSFRKILQEISTAEKKAQALNPDYTSRKVHGIFVGWRGLSLVGQGIENISFWDRKNTAEKIGHGAATEVFKSLETSYRQAWKNNDNMGLVVIGHSFGGDIVYSALSQILIDRFYDDKDIVVGTTKGKELFNGILTKQKTYDKKTFGDLVVLINPAFEAARFSPLHDLADSVNYTEDQLPLLVVMTSKTDTATKVFFPMGRWFSTFFEASRDDAQSESNRTAVGHFVPYFTHELTLLKETGATGGGEPQEADWKDITAERGWRLTMGETELIHKYDSTHKSDPRNPIMVISVDKEVMDGHNDIFNEVVRSFLSELIFNKIDNIKPEIRSW